MKGKLAKLRDDFLRAFAIVLFSLMVVLFLPISLIYWVFGDESLKESIIGIPLVWIAIHS